MKRLIGKMALLTVALLTAFVMTQCTKSDDSSVNNTADIYKTTSLDSYNYISPAEKAMIEEMGTDGIEEIIQCIYTCINSMPVEDLSAEEIEALNFVREEELLAHDVYVAMYDLYNIPVFNNISNSEFIHTTAIKAIMEKYNLPDPAAGHVQGVFADPAIQAIYDALVAQGSISFQEALIVGETIEDLDIDDLITHLMDDVDNTDITYTFNNLYKGSRNHLRAFYAHLNFQGITYTPIYISQELYDEIVGSPWEVGNGFCLCQYNYTEITDVKQND
jgi:hypothetical protein